jgi:hypothetical protein
VPKRLATGVLGGTVWGFIAAAVFLAMFRGAIPAPGEAGLAAILVVLLYFPFLVAVAVETAAGRTSSFAEIVGLTVASDAGLGILTIAGVDLVRRLARTMRARS